MGRLTDGGLYLRRTTRGGGQIQPGGTAVIAVPCNIGKQKTQRSEPPDGSVVARMVPSRSITARPAAVQITIRPSPSPWEKGELAALAGRVGSMPPPAILNTSTSRPIYAAVNRRIRAQAGSAVVS